jgi:hypothetical protein
MSRRKNFIATSAWAFALTIAAGVCQAQSIGTVTDLQGSLLSKNAAGAIKILALDSAVASGDRLLTRPGTYARVSFTDRSAVTLGPETELLIVQYSYSDTAHANSAVLDFVQGRVQIAAGRLGERSVDRFMLNTSAGTISVGRATFIAAYGNTARTVRLQVPMSLPMLRAPLEYGGRFENVVYHPPTDASRPRLMMVQNVPPSASGLNPGLYVQVIDGTIHITNNGGAQSFTAGQFGFTASLRQPPVVVPANPGMQFTPPPVFTSTPGGSGSTASKSGDVNCQVR